MIIRFLLLKLQIIGIMCESEDCYNVRRTGMGEWNEKK